MKPRDDIDRIRRAAASLQLGSLSEKDLTDLIAAEVEESRKNEREPHLGYAELTTAALLEERGGILRFTGTMDRQFLDAGHLVAHLAAIDAVLRERGVAVDDEKTERET